MEIKPSGSQPSGKGPAEYFTGTVRIDPLFQAPAPARNASKTKPAKFVVFSVKDKGAPVLVVVK